MRFKLMHCAAFSLSDFNFVCMLLMFTLQYIQMKHYCFHSPFAAHKPRTTLRP